MFKLSVLLVALATLTCAEELLYVGQSCGEYPGTSLYADTAGECMCGKAADAPATATLCTPPGGEAKYALAACTMQSGAKTSKCEKRCTTDAALEDGKCVKVTLAPGLEPKKVFGDLCNTPDLPLLIARTGGGCRCDRADRPVPAGTPCNKAPANATPFCLTNTAGLGQARCDFDCKTGFKKNEAKDACVEDKAPPPIHVIDPKPDPTKPDPVTGEACPPFMEFAFALPTGKCSCIDDEADPSVAGGTKCAAPPANGVAVCNIVGTKAECGIKCDAGFKDSGSKTCVSAAKEESFTNSKCSANPPGNFYLTAVPGKGCECQKAASPGWCKKPAAAGAKIECYQNVGFTIVECRAKNCPAGTEAKGAECVNSLVTKAAMDCDTGEYLSKSDTQGCHCAKDADPEDTCWGPKDKTAPHGDAICTMKPDKSEAKCSVQCDPGFKLSGKRDCVAV